jgi:hypothetical protein
MQNHPRKISSSWLVQRGLRESILKDLVKFPELLRISNIAFDGINFLSDSRHQPPHARFHRIFNFYELLGNRYLAGRLFGEGFAYFLNPICQSSDPRNGMKDGFRGFDNPLCRQMQMFSGFGYGSFNFVQILFPWWAGLIFTLLLLKD